MKNIPRILSFLLLFSIVFCLHAQKKYTTRNKKAIANYERAIVYLDSRDYKMAELKIKEALEKDPDFVEAHLLMGELFFEKKENLKAIKSFKEAIEINPAFFPKVHFNTARLELLEGKYKDAFNRLNYYKKNFDLQPAMKMKTENLILRAQFGMQAVENPVPFVPKNMGENINSTNGEYLPALTADEKTLVITVRRPKDEFTVNQINREEEDFYISYYKESGWTKARRMGAPLNTHDNEGAQCISPDGRYIIFTGCNRREGIGSCDLYISTRVGEKWSKPLNLGEKVNSIQWDSQPTLSSDGRTLYFSSARPGGKGKMDIWKTTLGEDGEWAEPVNLGEPINTPGNEASPFIHSDGQTLYFSSDYHMGMGGADIFYTRLNDGIWGKPVNIGYPINTHLNEMNLLVNTAGDKAFFSSDKLGGYGGFDLYSFDLYKEARPLAVTYMKGKVFDKESGKELDASFILTDLKTGEVKIRSTSDPVDGGFLVCLPTNKKYALTVVSEGYLFYSETFDLTTVKTKHDPFLADVAMEKMEVGKSIVLKNIFFETASFELLAESTIELDRMAKLIRENPSLKFEIGGHTDNVGSEEDNQILSENRAKAVFEYLISRGIDKDHLSYKGYGEVNPIADNNTEEGRAKNRRTEFTIVE